MSDHLGDCICVVLCGTIFLFSKFEMLHSLLQVTGMSKGLQQELGVFISRV